MKVVTSSEMKEIDKITIENRGVSGIELMEKAGEAVAEFILAKYSPHKISIVAGKGNNAGDGFVVARLLSNKAIQVSILFLANKEELTPDALANYNLLPENVQQIVISDVSDCKTFFEQSDLIVDAILGTGVKGEVKGLFGEVISEIVDSKKPVVSIDIPSGLSGDGEYPSGPIVKANQTVTIGLPKLGMVISSGLDYVGEMSIAKISFPEDLLSSEKLKNNLIELSEVKSYFPKRIHDGNKRTFGYVLIVAGSNGMTGAAILSAKSAARSGAGLIYVATPYKLSNIVETNLLEPVKVPIYSRDGLSFDNSSIDNIHEIAEKVDVVAIGMGIGSAMKTQEMVYNILPKINKPLILDADGLNAIQNNLKILRKRKYPTIVTPHPGEMARLLNITPQEIQKNRIKYAKDFSKEYGVITILKGERTLIADEDENLYINPTGNTSLAKGGSGDVLSGLISGFAAQSLSPVQSAIAGVFIHGLSADIAISKKDPHFILPSDIIDSLNDSFKLIFTDK